MMAAVTALHVMPHYHISAITLTASPNSTGATEANLTMNQKTIIAGPDACLSQTT